MPFAKGKPIFTLMPKALIYILLIIPALVAGVLLTIYTFQENLIFYPDKLSDAHRFIFDSTFEEITFEVDREIFISALHFKTEKPKGVVYYHHGNAGNLQGWGQSAGHFVSRGYDVLMYDYRGFGRSTGSIHNERMLHQDAQILYEHLLKQYKEENIILYGVSLGTGIAAKLASIHKPAKLILETPYYSFFQVSKFHYPYLPTSLLLKYKLNTYRYLKDVNCPIFLIHGTDDLVVPYESSIMLKKAVPNCELITIVGGSHNDLSSFSEYTRALAQILP